MIEIFKKFFSKYCLILLLIIINLDFIAQGNTAGQALSASSVSPVSLTSTSSTALPLTNTTELTADRYTVPAVLTTTNQATISTEIEGTIKEILVKEGDYFKINDVLLKFDCTVYDADLEKYKAEMEVNQEKYQAMKKLSDLDGASKAELLNSQAEQDTSISKYKIAKYKDDRCILKAPFDGQMAELKVRNFETVKAGDKLFTIVDNKKLDITAIVPSEWLKWLKVDAKFDLFLKETNKNYGAQVTKIIYNVDSVSQSVKVLGKITSDSSGLYVGQSGNAIFKGP